MGKGIRLLAILALGMIQLILVLFYSFWNVGIPPYVCLVLWCACAGVIWNFIKDIKTAR